MDPFFVAVAVLALAIVLFIVMAVRRTRGQVDRLLEGTDPRAHKDVARDLVGRIREQADRVACVRCGGPTFALLGTETRYRCDACQHVFEGPPHGPGPGP